MIVKVMHQQSKSCYGDCQSVARRPPASKEGGMVALSQMPTFLAVEQKEIYGDIMTSSEVICENGKSLVVTGDEKTASPINA